MNDGGNFEIRYSNKFEATYRSILRAHYRKNVAQGEEFEKLFDRLEESIVTDPYFPGVVREPWPGPFGPPGWDLCKVKFLMPGLKGASKLGRLLYAVDGEDRQVYFLWVYTHQEFSKQPPTKDLRKAVREVVRYLSGT